MPALHAGQQEIFDSEAKRKIIVCGRRWGKTILACVLAVYYMLRGKRVLYAAPTTDQTDAFWIGTGKGDGVKAYLYPLLKLGLIKKNETKRFLWCTWPGGGSIRAKTAFNADTLRGDNADLLILDEFGIMKSDAWTKVGAPMLLDNGGDAIFIFTPNRMNHAHQLYVKAKQKEADGNGRWAAWNAPSHDNPHLDEEALAEITQDMTDDEYKQEILAMFLENAGAVFSGIDASLWSGMLQANGLPIDSSAETPDDARPIEPADVSGHRIVIGCDWGKRQDYTAFSVVDASTGRELEIYRGRGDQYRLQRKRLAALREKWGATYILAEINSMGEPILEELDADGLPVEGFSMTTASKPPLIESMVLAVEQSEIQWLDDEVGKAEMQAYERKVSSTGRSRYSAPEGVHDDTVIARALALKAARDAGTGMGDNEEAKRRSRPNAAGVRSEAW